MRHLIQRHASESSQRVRSDVRMAKVIRVRRSASGRSSRLGRPSGSRNVPNGTGLGWYKVGPLDRRSAHAQHGRIAGMGGGPAPGSARSGSPLPPFGVRLAAHLCVNPRIPPPERVCRWVVEPRMGRKHSWLEHKGDKRHDGVGGEGVKGMSVGWSAWATQTWLGGLPMQPFVLLAAGRLRDASGDRDIGSEGRGSCACFGSAATRVGRVAKGGGWQKAVAGWQRSGGSLRCA